MVDHISTTKCSAEGQIESQLAMGSFDNKRNRLPDCTCHNASIDLAGERPSHWVATMGDRRDLVIVLAALALFVSAAPIRSRNVSAQEQSSFGMEEVPGVPRVGDPIEIPDAIMRILAADKQVESCLKDSPLGSGQTLRPWFIASVVDLSGSGERDIVILPAEGGDRYPCFHSTEGVGWFWVFRRKDGQYRLVLKTIGLRLSILDTRHDGYRDIRTDSLAGKSGTMTTFKFDGDHYGAFQKRATRLQ